MSDVETVTIQGLRYVVAVLRPNDLERIAKLVAIEINKASDERVAEDLALERARQVPYEVIEAASTEPPSPFGDSPYRLQMHHGQWVKVPR